MEEIKLFERARCWKPGSREHGLVCYVAKIISIDDYLGGVYTPQQRTDRGPNAYEPTDRGWFDDATGETVFNGALPQAMVVSEFDFNKMKA